MQTIHKYSLHGTGDTLKIGQRTRAGVDILSFEFDSNDELCIWARVDTEMPLVPVRVDVVGTGMEADHTWDMTFLGTKVMGEFVWHVFYKVR